MILQGERLKELMAKYPSIAFKVLDELSRRLENAENRIEDISLSSVTNRVASALLEFSGGGREILLPMTKGDLASQLGMTQETLSRKLSALQEEGLIGSKAAGKSLLKTKRNWKSSSWISVSAPSLSGSSFICLLSPVFQPLKTILPEIF